eukprot:2063451-Rhodomonas_salina.1
MAYVRSSAGSHMHAHAAMDDDFESAFRDFCSARRPIPEPRTVDSIRRSEHRMLSTGVPGSDPNLYTCPRRNV